MRAVVMRVSWAEVRADGELVASIARGQAALIGFGRDDGPQDLEWMARKLHALRIFPDDQGRLSLSADALGFGHLLVPQFTLYGDVQRGHRPDFGPALPPDAAREMWQEFVRLFGASECGVFGADMRFVSENDGPVTILIASRRGAQEA